VTSPDLLPESTLRDAFGSVVRDDLAIPLSFIDDRASALRRRTQVRAVSLLAVAAVVLVVLLSSLTSGAKGAPVRVETPNGKGNNRTHHPKKSPNTLATTTTTSNGGRSANGTSRSAKTPTPHPHTPRREKTTPAQPNPGPVVSTPTPTTPTTDAPTPDTTPGSSAPTTTSTTVPATPAPTVVMLRLDDDGLHAPVSFVADGDVHFRYEDWRSSTYGPTISIRVTTVDQGSSVISRQWVDEDQYGHYGAEATYRPLHGLVQFQVITYYSQQDVPGLYAETIANPS
jgi:hypothetical protein